MSKTYLPVDRLFDAFVEGFIEKALPSEMTYIRKRITEHSYLIST